MDLTPHEKKILELIRKYPKVVTNPDIRRQVAEKNSLSEKTLRNRIADFKKYESKKDIAIENPAYQKLQKMNVCCLNLLQTYREYTKNLKNNT